MENQPYNGYGTNLREGSSRRSQSFNQQSSSIDIGADGMSSNMGDMTTSSSYMKGVSYDQTTQNCDPYLYGNSSRGPNGSVQRKDRFIRSRDRMPNNHKSYPNDTDDELAFASASLAYRREELEARLRGNSTMDSVGSNSIRNRQSEILGLSSINFSPTSQEIMSRNPSAGRNSLEVPSFNTAPPLKRQYSTDARWNGGNRFIQQRSWDLHNSQTLVSHDPTGLAPPSMNESRGLSRSFDDSCITQPRNDKSPLSTNRKRAVLERGVTYHGDDTMEYHQDYVAPSSAVHVGGKSNQHDEYMINKGSSVDHRPSYTNETIVRDYKPGYKNIINESGTNEIDYPYDTQSSVRNRQYQQKLTNQDEYHHNTTNHGHLDARQSDKHHYRGSNTSYLDGSKHAQGIDDNFIEPADYRHLLNPQNENHTPGVYRKASKNGSIQWWKDQFSNSNVPYKESSGYGYCHPEDQRDSNNRTMQNSFKDAEIYPLNQNSTLPDVTVNVTGSDHDYNALSGNKSFWCKFNPLGSKGGRSQYNTTLQEPSINGQMINSTDNTKSHSFDQHNQHVGFGGRQEDMGHYNNNVTHFNSHMSNNNMGGISSGGGVGNIYPNENSHGMNSQMSYQQMNERMNNNNNSNSYAGFNTILKHQRKNGFNVSILIKHICLKIKRYPISKS